MQYIRVNRVQLFEAAKQQNPVTQHIDTSRHALSISVDSLKRFISKMGIIIPAHMCQTTFHVVLTFIFTQRTEVIISNHALAELFQVRVIQHLTKLHLTEQKGL